jgi:hypothetical protein
MAQAQGNSNNANTLLTWDGVNAYGEDDNGNIIPNPIRRVHIIVESGNIATMTIEYYATNPSEAEVTYQGECDIFTRSYPLRSLFASSTETNMPKVPIDGDNIKIIKT